MYGPGSRPRIVIEHDAKMRMLIEHLRSQHKPAAGYTDVRYWFVTESTRLPTYARLGIDGSGRPTFPFCILSSTWAQLLRAMVPRTSDLNGMVAALLASPFVGYRSAPRGTAQLTAIERITRSIDSLRDMPPAVAIAVVNDKAMSAKIGEETDPAVIEQMIEDALSAKAHELEAQLATAADRIVEAERVRDRAQADRLAAEKERDQLQGDRDRAVVEAERNQPSLSLRSAVIALSPSCCADRSRMSKSVSTARKLRPAKIVRSRAATYETWQQSLVASSSTARERHYLRRRPSRHRRRRRGDRRHGRRDLCSPARDLEAPSDGGNRTDWHRLGRCDDHKPRSWVVNGAVIHYYSPQRRLVGSQ